MYSGLQPAMTALIATFSTVHDALFGGIAPTTSCGSRVVPLSMRSTRTGVGGTTGSPSLQPREKHSSCSSSGACTSMTRAFRGGAPNATSRISGMPGSTLFEPQPGWKPGRSAPSGSRPVTRVHSARSQPMVRSVSAPPSRRMRVGTVSTAKRHECSSERSSMASMPSGNVGSSWVYTVSPAPLDAILRSTGCTRSQVGQSRLATTMKLVLTAASRAGREAATLHRAPSAEW